MIYKLFTSVINMGLTASVVILAVLLARFFLGRLPKKYSYLLWVIVGIRLICPFGVTSSLSVFNLVGEHTVFDASYPLSATEYEGKTLGTTGIRQTGDAQGSSLFAHTGETGDGQGSAKAPLKEKKKTAERKTGISDFVFRTGAKNIASGGNVIHPFVKYGTIVWLGVLSMLFFWNLFLWLQMRRRTASGIRLKDRIYECGEIPSPFVMGIICPRIYLPFRLGKEEQEYIIRHESYHIQRKDHIVKFIAFLLVCIYWFHPLVWLSYLLMIRDMEMSCDEYVLKKSVEDIRAAYSKSLLGFAVNRRNIGAGFLAFGESDTRRRVKHIMKFKEFGKWAGILAAVVILAVGAVCLTNAEEKKKTGNLIEASDVEQAYPVREFVSDENMESFPKKIANTEKVLAETEIHGYQIRVLYRSHREEADLRLEDGYYVGEKGTSEHFVIETSKEKKRIDVLELFCASDAMGGKNFFSEAGFSIHTADYDGDGEADDFAIGFGDKMPMATNFMSYQFYGIETNGTITQYRTSTDDGVSIATPPGDYSPLFTAKDGTVSYIGLGAGDEEHVTAGETTTNILHMMAVESLPDGYLGDPVDSLEKCLSELTGKVYEFVPDRGVMEEIAEHGVWFTGIYTDETGKKFRSYSLANSEDYDKVTLRLDFTFDQEGNLVDYVSKDYGFIQGLERAETEEDSFYGIKRFVDMFMDFYVVDGEKAVALSPNGENEEKLRQLLTEEETEERKILWLWEESLPAKYEGLDYALYSDGYDHHYLVDKKHDMLLRFESQDNDVAEKTSELKINEKQMDEAYQDYFSSRKGTVQVEGVDYWENGCDCRKISGMKVNLRDFTDYRTYDIDGDGVPEMIMGDAQKTEKTLASYQALICSFEEGRVRPVFAVRGMRGYFYKADNNRICAFFGGSDFSEYAFYTLKDGRFSFDIMYHTLIDNAIKKKEYSILYPDGKRKDISKAVSEKYLKKNILEEF